MDEGENKRKGKRRESHENSDVKRKEPLTRITQAVFTLIVIIFIWYLLADRYAPYTDQARTKTLTIPLIPKVSGYLSEINVHTHSIVKKGDLLFQIDKKPFELAVKKARAYLDNVSQQVGALNATVKAAAGRLGVAKAQLDRAQRNFNRTQHVLKRNPGALSQADLDQTETALAQAMERVSSSEADLEKAKQQLGISGKENAQLREAIVALEQVEYDLEQTSYFAPSDGIIESYNLYKGYYAQAGKALLTFIPSGTAWIEADFRENSLGNINAGDEVEFTLDAIPGEVFFGKVSSVGYGVSYGEKNDRGSLPKITSTQSWLRDPQRFPVIIEIADKKVKDLVRYGGQADVIIYAGNSTILNFIGRLQIRINSMLSYVR